MNGKEQKGKLKGWYGGERKGEWITQNGFGHRMCSEWTQESSILSDEAGIIQNYYSFFSKRYEHAPIAHTILVYVMYTCIGIGVMLQGENRFVAILLDYYCDR